MIVPTERMEENAARGPESARSNIGRGVRPRSNAARRRAKGAFTGGAWHPDSPRIGVPGILSRQRLPGAQARMRTRKRAEPRSKTADGGRARRQRGLQGYLLR